VIILPASHAMETRFSGSQLTECPCHDAYLNDGEKAQTSSREYDRWVPFEQSQRMAVSLSQAGVRDRLVLVPGARHGFELLVEFPEIRNLLPEVLAFLDSVWQVHLREHR
jgi:acetyl esterase/lipase